MPEKIGRYKIMGTLGKGAMGVVYKARDTKIDRIVAVKTISGGDELPEKDREEFKQRFFQEAHAAGCLTHPNIVGIYDVDEDAGHEISFITMEYVEGQSLGDLLAEQGALSPAAALAIIIPVTRALGFAHENGIVHRDIKPANILLDGEGRAKLTDFGIAKVPASKLTTSGQFLGTPGYMSPEQVFGGEIDGRSDLFSLAVVLYQMITGEMPFPGNNLTTITYKIVNTDPPPPTHINFRLGDGFDSFLARGMAKRPDQRFQTADEMAGELERLLGDEPAANVKKEQRKTDGDPAGPVAADPDAPLPGTVAGTMVSTNPAVPAVRTATMAGRLRALIKSDRVMLVTASGIIAFLLLTNAYVMWDAGEPAPGPELEAALSEAVAVPELVKKYDLRTLAAVSSSTDWSADQTIMLADVSFPSVAPPPRPVVVAAAAETVEVRSPEIEVVEPVEQAAAPIPEAVPEAALNLVLRHPFESGTLVVYAGGEQIHEMDLGPDDAEDSKFKKKMRTLGRKLKLKRLHAKGIVVPAGCYELGLAVVREEGEAPPLAILPAEFSEGQERSLTVVCGRKSSAEMDLKWVDN